MARLALIPARGGSKRIHRKNIKEFLGKPIISYSIGAALESLLFDEVMVSTDDDDIAKIAEIYGACVPFKRSDRNSNDIATTFDVIQEVLEYYRGVGKEFETVCCIYPCAPFVSGDLLKSTFEFFTKSNFSTVIPVVKYDTPIQRSFSMGDNNAIKYAYPQFALSRSQDLTPYYHDAGQFYWIDTLQSLSEKTVITSNTAGIIIPGIETHDIDSNEDWEMAELKFRFLNSKNE